MLGRGRRSLNLRNFCRSNAPLGTMCPRSCNNIEFRGAGVARQTRDCPRRLFPNLTCEISSVTSHKKAPAFVPNSRPAKVLNHFQLIRQETFKRALTKLQMLDQSRVPCSWPHGPRGPWARRPVFVGCAHGPVLWARARGPGSPGTRPYGPRVWVRARGPNL